MAGTSTQAAEAAAEEADGDQMLQTPSLGVLQTPPPGAGSFDGDTEPEDDGEQVQPWGYLYALSAISHGDSQLLFITSCHVGSTLRRELDSSSPPVSRLDRCIVHLQDECNLSLFRLFLSTCQQIRQVHRSPPR